MRPGRIITAAMLTAVVAVTGCTARSTVHPAAPPAATPATTAATVTAPTTGPAATGGATMPAVSTRGPAWPTGPRRGAAGGGGELVAIRTARHQTFDRVVFQFRGKLPPSYQVRYVPRVTEDPSDRPVSLQGRAFLWMVFQGASTMDVNLRPVYTGSSTITTGFPTLKQVKLAGDFERVLSFGVGLDHRTGFRVLTLTSPSRIAIDVAR